MKNISQTQDADSPSGAKRGQLIPGPWHPRNAKVAAKPSAPKKLPECVEFRVGRKLPYRVHVRQHGARDYSAQFATLKEAVTARDRWRAHAHALRTAGVNDSVTVADAFAGYVKSDAYCSLSQQAQRSTDGRVKYWQERLGNTRLADLPGHALAVERDRLSRIKNASSTVCGYLSTFSCAWTWAHENEGAVANQVTSIRWPKISRERPRKFTAEQLQYLLKKADGYKLWPPLGLLVRFSLLTTQRRVTCLSPRWHQVDLDTGTVEIPATKNGRAMSLVIMGETLSLLREHARTTGAKPSDYVFASPTMDKPMEVKKHVDQLFNDRKLVDGNGRRLTFKHLRSTAMSRLFTHAKVDLPRAMAITGHKTARVLLEHYAHADVHENRAVIEKHGDTLLGR